MDNGDPIEVVGPEQSLLIPELSDGGLPPVVGVKSYQVFRASRDAPELSDDRGWTYHHHVDLAVWRGKLYVGWNSCEKDEDVWPSRELLSTSSDGIEWERPREMFPQGISTPLRMYFYRARNDVMLIIAGLRLDTTKTCEDRKAGLVVRRVYDDHTLGPVFVLQNPGEVTTDLPTYQTSGDPSFKLACQELLADTVYLEQQDRGRLLGNRAMKWHVPENAGKWVFGKAFSFFTRPDGAIVGICKMGHTVISHDGGKTWSAPVVPSTLITGKAKVWTQKTSDGRYALVYNPSVRQRWPLVIVTGTDGIRFQNMRTVQGELPIQRYEGDDRSIGPQYTRGVSIWSDDKSRSDSALWLVYSMSKEDIWVSRIPVPVEPDETCNQIDENLSTVHSLDRWNVYKPRWNHLNHHSEGLQIVHQDPYDYVALTRCFKPTRGIRAMVDLEGENLSQLCIELVSHFGSKRYPLSEIRRGKNYVKTSEKVSRLVIRTGPYRNVGGKHPVPRGSDRPISASSFMISKVQLQPL
ncbi:MAG: hypothetical protein KatS3mg104_0725 [Phycisphaerae bacterium]|nr:MAG: hypothetical protein KatS3mg104_0725 [Phycisphaerae bacterium]